MCNVNPIWVGSHFNYVWEWPFLGNLLKPGTFPNLLKYGELDTEAFMKQFIVNPKTGDIKNENLFLEPYKN